MIESGWRVLSTSVCVRPPTKLLIRKTMCRTTSPNTFTNMLAGEERGGQEEKKKGKKGVQVTGMRMNE